MKYLFFLLGFLFLGMFLYSQDKNAWVFHRDTEILLNTKSHYFIAVSNDENSNLQIKQLKDVDAELPINAKAIWMVFDINTSYTDSLFIYTKHKIPKADLFKKEGNKVVKIAHTGFANKLINASIKNEYNVIHLPLNSNGKYFLKFSPERYMVGIPKVYISTRFYEDAESKSVSRISLVTSGFQFAIFFSAIIFLFFNYRRPIMKMLVFFLLVNVTDTLYFLSRYYIVLMESPKFDFTNSMVWNILGDINILLYYLFYQKFFEIPTKSLVGKFIKFGAAFWIVQIFIELSDFHSIFWIKFATAYLNLASVIDFIILIAIFIYVIIFKLNETYYRIGFIGLIFMTFSAAEIAYPHIFGTSDWVDLKNISFKILQFCILINILSFVSAIIYKIVVSENEKALYKEQILHNEIDRQKSLEHERERISSDMHDELGAGISAIKLQSEFLKQQANQEKINPEEIENLIAISNEMNLSMREMLWTLSSKNESLQVLIDYVINYINRFFSKTKIQVKIQNHILNDDTTISYEERRNILLVIKEASNNILKHSNATLVKIFIDKQDNLLNISIQDNGKGIDQNHHEGYGLSNMKLRIANINGTFRIESSGKGTTVFISLQLN